MWHPCPLFIRCFFFKDDDDDAIQGTSVEMDKRGKRMAIQILCPPDGCWNPVLLSCEYFTLLTVLNSVEHQLC